jgi:hypothetical protein
VADGLCAPFGFERPLRNHQPGRATYLLFERGGDARDFIQSLVAIIHLTPLSVLGFEKKPRRQQLTETIIPAGSWTAGVEPGVDISQVALSGVVKWHMSTGASVPRNA